MGSLIRSYFIISSSILVLTSLMILTLSRPGGLLRPYQLYS